jgi:putative endonuclease
MKNKRRLGSAYENRVAEHLRQQGYRILEQNFHSHFGEIDIIAQKDGYLIFVEVKYRSNASFGTPMEAVNYRKQNRISNTASYYLYSHKWPMDTPCRFDVAAVSNQSIQILENAFPYRGNFGG